MFFTTVLFALAAVGPALSAPVPSKQDASLAKRFENENTVLPRAGVPDNSARALDDGGVTSVQPNDCTTDDEWAPFCADVIELGTWSKPA